ncbi:hypothetical protein L484_004813 [Morus notabilis]|uniref:Retrotransposon gag domain-containing protein n=1 Tax=Morus notabilis TaxID=981085 RepID=W9R9S0_9ROSA|nr:hypothetical protein L484_004813 [Morus notabilis]
MTWFHSTAGRSSRRKQYHRRTPTPQDYSSTYDDDYTTVVRSPNDSTEFDQPENDDDDNDDASDAPTDSATNPLSDQFSSVSERINARKKSCSASHSPILHLPQQPVSQTGYNSYMNIAQFPIFRGGSEECPFAHLSRFAKVCRANNVSSIDMMMKIFPVTLEDEAALWYDLNVEPYEELSWEEIKSSFYHAYGKIELTEQLRSQLMTINQGDAESVRSYFLRLQWILKKWPEHGLSDDLLKGVFVDGLRGDFQEWMAPQKPGSLNKALRLAFCFEQVKSIRNVRRNASVKCGFCGGLHEERGCEVRERMRELWLKSNKDDGLGKGMLERNLIEKSEGVKELGRSVSMATSRSTCVVGKNDQVEEDGKEEEDELGSKKKRSQCQCGKHQCWKKNIERNNSTVSGNL